MAVAPAKTAEEIADTLRSIIDKVRDSDLPSSAAESGRDIAGNVGDVATDVAERAGDVARDLAKGARRTWRRGVGRGLGDVWKRRNVAIGAAGAAVPASRQLVDSAAVRLGLKKREERHWGTFFLGLILGALAGVAVAILTAPKPGREIREDLAARAREAGDWVPVFQRTGEGGAPETNGGATAATSTTGATASALDRPLEAATSADVSSTGPTSGSTGSISPAGSTGAAVPPILSEDGGAGTEGPQH